MIKNRLIPRVFAALTALALGALTVGVSSCVKDQEIAVKSVTANPTSITLDVGETATISYTLSPDNATNKNVVFMSGNENVATVTDAGLVTAVGPGSTSISVASVDGPKATVSVTVREPVKVVPVSGVSLDKTELTLTEGDTANLSATVSPADATDKSITWSSSDDNVATVADGKVTAVAAGKATITVKTNDGGKTATCSVTVQKKVIAVTGVTLDKTELTLTEGETANLTATVAPADATDKSVTWSTSDEKVATVADGKVSAVAPGTATITVKTNDGGKTATGAVTVEKKVIAVTGVTLDKNELSLVEGESATLAATVAPEDASDKSVTWSTSDEKVATVADGKVTAVAPGTATITVKTNDGGKTATCAVTVTAKPIAVTGVEVSPTSVTVTEGKTVTLTATVAPEDATDKSVAWSSSDEKVATVADGVVTAVAPGKALITVTTTDGGFKATCAVTVTAKPVPVTGVSVEPATLTLEEGGTGTITAKVAPVEATNKNVSWSTSDAKVATVANGVVTAVAPGTATITATTEDGGYKATCAVTVEKKNIPVTSVSFKEGQVTVKTGKTIELQLKIEPENATDKSIQWSSNKEEIATVKDGVVTGVSVGTAVITALNKSSGMSDGCIVNVIQGEVEITGITANPKAFYLGVDCSYAFKPGTDFTVTPSNATYMNPTDFDYVSSNTSVATITEKDGKMVVYGSSTGSTTISGKPKQATTVTSNQKMRDINVIKPTVKVVEIITSGALSVGDSFVEGNTVTMAVGEKVKVALYNGSTRMVLDNQQTYGSGSYNSSVVEVDDHQNSSYVWTELYAKKTGTTDVGVALIGDNGFVVAEFTVNVVSSNPMSSGDYISYASSYKGNSTSHRDSLAIGYGPLTLYLYSSSGSNYNGTSSCPALKWSSNNTSVAEISYSSGGMCQVTAKAKGDVTITAQDLKNNKRYFYIRTYYPVTDIWGLSNYPLNIAKGCKYKMRPGVDYELNSETDLRSPDNFYWTSSDYSYVSIEDSTGEMTAKSNTGNDTGSVTIYAIPKTNGANIDKKKVRTVRTITSWSLNVVSSTCTSSSADKAGRYKNCNDDVTLTVDKGKTSYCQFTSSKADTQNGNLIESGYSVSDISNSNVTAKIERDSSFGYALKVTGVTSGTTTLTLKYHTLNYYFEKKVTVKVL